jgi:hypothetical protein
VGTLNPDAQRQKDAAKSGPQKVEVGFESGRVQVVIVVKRASVTVKKFGSVIQVSHPMQHARE